MARSILVADDSAVARRAIRNLLTHSFGDGVTYAEASNGLEALNKATISKPDVVILDISMPGLNGLEAASRITEHWPKTPVLAISNYDVEAIAPRFRQCGIRGFVPKVSIGFELIPAIQALLEGKTHFTSAAVAV